MTSESGAPPAPSTTVPVIAPVPAGCWAGPRVGVVTPCALTHNAPSAIAMAAIDEALMEREDDTTGDLASELRERAARTERGSWSPARERVGGPRGGEAP